ncbi:MAG: hypothetical protein IJ785_08390 [Bacteroidales bacterium]|nr:hypothetical protein [Bacteroidales bacterium]
MSKTIRNLMMALMTVTTVAFVSCKKEEVTPSNPDTGGDNTELTTLKGTSWVGIYDDSYQGYPAELTYSLDFTSETEGSLMVELKVNGVDQTPQTVNFTYTFSDNVAMCTIPNVGPFSVTYDPQTNTMTASIALSTEDGGAIGGATTFYPRGTDPIPHSGDGGSGDNPGQGEYTEDFPAGSSWTATEAATYQGTPIDIYYTLTYDNYHAGTIVIDVRMQGQSIGGQTLNHTWTYNAETAQGAFMLQGNGINFFYDAAGDHITTSLPLGFSESETFGSDLVFSRIQ